MMLGLTASRVRKSGGTSRDQSCGFLFAGVVSLKLVGRLKCFRPTGSFCSKCAVEKFFACFFEELNYQVHFCKWSSKPFTLHWCLLPQMSSYAHH